jgi:ABC-type branched-subunit amino acid transport system ATPase component/signal transduction histidine kinase
MDRKENHGILHSPVLLELDSIYHSYGEVNSLHKLSFSVREGETRALIGEHGAGKSTVAKIISGFLRPDCGSVLWKGTPLEKNSPKLAQKRGIRIVPQNIELFPNQTVAFNLFNGTESVYRSSFYSKRRIEEQARNYLQSIGCAIPHTKLLRELNFPQKAMVAILRHVYTRPKLLVIDETIEKLSAKDLAIVAGQLKTLTDEGSAIVYITHRIDDIYQFADSVSILRNGTLILTEDVRDIDKINLIKLAYTQVANHRETQEKTDKEFYHLLKYNQAILEFLPLAVLVIDQNREIKLVNKMGETFFSQPEDTICSSSLEGFCSALNKDTCADLLSLIEKREQSALLGQKIEIGGNEANCSIITYPIMDGNYYIGTILVFVDNTEYEKMREKIAFSEKLSSIGILAAGVAHEINNPLEIIENYLNYLIQQAGETENGKYLGYISEEFTTIKDIVGNLITFSENRIYENSDLDLSAYLDQLAVLSTTGIKRRNIEVVRDIEQGIHILANKVRIRQVVTNIIKNAFEAMEEGGMLTIRLHREADEAVLTFLDTGEGIAKKKKDDLFLPFYSTKYGNNANMGLGMSIIYKIVTNYGGNLSIENRQDVQGCIVTVRLPLAAGRLSETPIFHGSTAFPAPR